jgi:hypothetical protein
MLKLTNILTENYGGPGEMVLPPNHKAGLKVPKGGSCCANCEYWKEGKEGKKGKCTTPNSSKLNSSTLKLSQKVKQSNVK